MDDPTDVVWDDGEWISWDHINGQLYEQEIQRVPGEFLSHAAIGV